MRSEVTASEWNKIKKATATKANRRCEICNGIGKKWPVECHEIWHYDDDQQIQLLIGMIALCPSCHQVKHYGLSLMRGLEKKVFAHLMKVNSWDRDKAKAYIEESFITWNERSSKVWELDISYLENFGICL